MAEIDGSIPAGVKVPQNDFGATIGNITALQGQLLNNKMLGLKIAGQQALGRAVQANTNDSGDIDTQGVNRAVAANPDAAFTAADSAEQMQGLHNAHVAGATAEIQRQIASGQLTTQGLDQSATETKNGADLAASLLLNRDKIPLTRQNVMDAASDAIAAGRIRTKAGIAHIMSQAASMTDDPKQNEALLNQAYLAANATSEAVNTVRGQIQSMDTGGQIQQFRIDPVTGEKTLIAAPVAKTLAPQILPTIGADNRPHATVVGGGSASGVPNGRYPGGSTQSADLGTTGFAPGEAPTMEASAKAYQDDVAAVPSVKKALFAFDQAGKALANAPTGKGSDVLQNLRGLAETYNLPLPAATKDETKNYAEANKWLSSALTQEASRLGLSTDAARALQSEAQPGVQTPHAAAVAMLPILGGLKAMDLAAPIIAQNDKITPQAYSAWRSNWANSVDPLAFSANKMSLADRKALMAKMKPDEVQKYINGAKAAIAAGIYSQADLSK